MSGSVAYSGGQCARVKAFINNAVSLSALTVILLVSVCAVSGCGSDDANDAAPQTARAAAPARSGRKTHPKAARKAVLVHSYPTGYPWVDGITRGVRMSLSGSGVDLRVFYMDTKRQTSEAWKIQAGQRAKDVVDEWKPDVVIAADDNAQQYFVTTFPTGAEAPQFVFCGVNAEPAEYGYPRANVTGILERPHFAASFDMLARIQPNVKRIAFITDDSPTSKGVIAHLKTLQLNYDVVSIDAPATFLQWQQAVEQRQTTVDALAIFNYHTVRKGEGAEQMVPADVMKWTTENCSIPIIGFQVFTVDDGALCGYLESAVEHGMKAGTMTLEILRGTPAGDIPLITALEGQSMLNLITARRLGIRVPPELIAQTDVTIGQ